MEEYEDLEKIVISYQSPNGNAFAVLEEGEYAFWPELLIEFAKVLNKAGYIIPIDIVEKWVHNGIVKEHQKRLQEKALHRNEDQLEFCFNGD
jgi:hypothetical protein